MTATPPIKFENAEIYNYKIIKGDVDSYFPQADTLGIEVTNSQLAENCGLGNIDPQHTQRDHYDNDPPAAIEAALDCELPKPGSEIITVKPDMDSLGAMAVLLLRNYYDFDNKSTEFYDTCLLCTSPSPRDRTRSRMPSSA